MSRAEASNIYGRAAFAGSASNRMVSRTPGAILRRFRAELGVGLAARLVASTARHARCSVRATTAARPALQAGRRQEGPRGQRDRIDTD